MATITQTIPFNFDDIYGYIEGKFEDAGYDTQEGSNTMQLVTAMSYLVSMLNANTAANVNETILTLARKRALALKDARVLGYEASHITSYQYELTLEFSTPGTYRISKYDTFVSGDYTYYYLGDTTDSFTVLEGVPEIKTITVIEGELKSYTDEQALTTTIDNVYDSETETWAAQTYVDLAYTNVEENGIEMFLTYYDDDGIYHELEEWTKSSRYMIDTDTDLNKEFVRLDLIDYGTPRLHFKLGDIGKDLRVGTIVYMNALISSGVDGKMTETPTTDLECTVTNYSLSVQGAAEETLSSIKTNAPLFNNTANRVVTVNDYESFCNKQTSVKTSVVWDGQDEYPTQGGYIWFSFIPSTAIRTISDANDEGYTWVLQDKFDTDNWYIENDEIQDVYDVLDNYKIPTLEFFHRHPIYFDFDYEINIPRYKIVTSEAAINEAAFNVINDYFLIGDTESVNPVESFDFEYFQSNLIKRIDEELTDNMGFNISLTTSIHLHDKLIIEETFDDGDTPYQEIRLHLGVPFEGIFDGNDVIFDNLPIIDTENFISTRRLYLDEDTLLRDAETEITTIDIKLSEEGAANAPLTDDVIGQYRVFNKTDADIEIILYVISVEGYSVGIDTTYLEIPVDYEEGDPDPAIRMQVVYSNSNMPFNRNTIPRLKSVSFT